MLRKWKLLIAGIGVAIIAVVSFLTIISPSFVSPRLVPITIQVDSSHVRIYNHTLYYATPDIINVTEQSSIRFDNVIFNYKGSAPISDNECDANTVNATFSDYKATERRRFEIIINDSKININTCWPPPYLGPFPEYPVYEHKSGGIQTSGHDCPSVYLWSDSNNKIAAIEVHLTEGQWHMPSGDVYRLYCDHGMPSIHYIVKAVVRTPLE